MTEDQIIQQIADQTTAQIADSIWAAYLDVKTAQEGNFEIIMSEICIEIISMQYKIGNDCSFLNAALFLLVEEEEEEDDDPDDRFQFPYIKAAIAWYLLENQ